LSSGAPYWIKKKRVKNNSGEKEEEMGVVKKRCLETLEKEGAGDSYTKS